MPKVQVLAALRHVSRSRAAQALLLAGSVACYVASFALPVPALRPGIDPSIWYAANTYRDYELEIGTDIVHVFGPLGWLVYPIARSSYLLTTFLITAALHGLFLASMILYAVRRRALGAVAAVVLVCSAFFFGANRPETPVFGICITWLILDLLTPGAGYGILAAAVSAVYALAKFNMTVTLLTMLCTQVAVARIMCGERWRYGASKLVTFCATAGGLAAMCFSTPSAFLEWLGRSGDIAAGNSEAMSVIAPQSQVNLALIDIGIVGLLGLFQRRNGRPWGLLWLLVVAGPLYFEFKHGFVRADAHVYSFFSMAAVVAVTRLLTSPPRWALALVVAAAAVAAIGPAGTTRPIAPTSWIRGLRFAGIGRLINWREFAFAQMRRESALLSRVSMSQPELAVIGDDPVELIPHDVTPLIGTSLRWRPSPFFQHILIRSLQADSTNARHLAGPDAAEYVVWSWHDQDGVHPMDRCPLTYRALLSNYRFLRKTGGRLLLTRGAGRPVRLESLGSVDASWGSPIAIPSSPRTVVAQVSVKRTVVGRLMRVLYRVPPAFVVFDDGTERRFIPTTAAHGLVVSREPRNPHHFRHLFESGRPHPACPVHRTILLDARSHIKYFADEVKIDFFGLAIGYST